MAYPATPKTWVAGDVLTAAQLNAELRDALLGAFPLGPPDTAWTSYTPTLTQPGAVTKTVTYAKYQRVGRLIVANGLLTCTGTGTAANQVAVGLPVAAAQAANMPAGSLYIFDASAGLFYNAVLSLTTTTTGVGFVNASGNALGVNSFTAALAAADIVGFSAIYESAT